MIQINNISKRFGDLVVLNDVSAKIKKGECIAIIGPSGTGKSVFLRTIAMLERPDQGKIFINETEITQKGTDINRIREKMGMVYQGFHLFAHLNVIDNITLAPVKVKKRNKAIAEKQAMELLSIVGLSDKARSFPHELSGGQQQRIAIARCLAMEPEILLFDEPTSALDPAMTSEVLAIIRKLTTMGLTMLIVTHEMSFAKDVSNRIFFMEEGGIYEEGTPSEIFENPKREKTNAFIRKLKVFNFEIHSKGFDIVNMNVQIEIFCRKYNIQSKKVYHIQLLLEELLLEIFKHCYDNSHPELTYTIEYSEDSKEVVICLIYEADRFNPFENKSEDDNLGMLLVNSISKYSEYLFEKNQNTLTIKF